MTELTSLERVAPTDLATVSFSVNGTRVTLSIPARLTLSDALRDHLGLTGTHVGCEHGVCGMCTIKVDGQAARACLLFAVQLEGSEITTVEGLGRPDDLHPLQESFGKHHALQCGFCTPGFLMSSLDLLEHHPEVTREELPEELSGVLCRCTGYRNILDAVDDVARSYPEGVPAPLNCGSRNLVGRSLGAAASSAPSPDETDSVTVAETFERPDEIVMPQGEPTIGIYLTKTLTSPLEDVLRVLDDIYLLARCLPGAALTDDLGDDWYQGRARIALGPIKMSFNALAHIADPGPEQMKILAQGNDPKGGGAQADIRVRVERDDSGGTQLHAEAKVFLHGKIASFGRSLAGDVSRRMFEDFVQAVDDAAQGREVKDSTKPPSAFKILLGSLRDRRRRRKESRKARSKK